MGNVFKSVENSATEYDDPKKKQKEDIETKMSTEKLEKPENEKEFAEVQKTITEFEQTKLKKKPTVLEPLASEQKEEMAENSSDESEADYEQAKLQWQGEMIASYCKNLLKVQAMPLLPRGQKCSFSEIYVRPTIKREIKIEKEETKEIMVRSMSEIFTKNGVPLRKIYVLGDAGSGKSSFCKYLVNCWCIAKTDAQIVEDEFDGVKEMKKFDIMFYISLKHNRNIDSVQDMIRNQYDIDISSPVLKKDSAKIIILLDGLDEWSSERKSYNQFQTMSLPKQDVNKDYTVVTTSRPWKVHTFGINETEIDQLLNLKGFDERCERELIDRTVLQLNSSRNASKDAKVCKQKLEEKSLKKLKQLPILLHLLICLWFDGKLDKTTSCAIYTGMLELFFTWNDMKTTGTSTGHIKGAQKEDLPKYLADKNILKLNSHLIYELSHLAYETQFNCPKDKSLTFDIPIFNELEISDEVRENCLKLGIMTEDECLRLSVLEPTSSLFSFIHKSMQEFLAAVNISICSNAKIGSSDSTDYVELANKFIFEVFRKCSTVNDMLEQSNVVIMLCGLEPRLATHVSKYIYDTVAEDSRVQDYRRTISSDNYMDHRYITDIQKLMFESMEECIVGSNPLFLIGDLVINTRSQYCDIVCSGIDKKQIVPDSVLSINVGYTNTENVKLIKYLPMFHHLEKIKITCESASPILLSTQSNRQMIDELNNCIAETIKVNTSTLKSLSLSAYYTGGHYPVYKTVVSNLPSMINLVAISISFITMSHDDTTTFCKFLEETSHLEQIELEYVDCKCVKQHDVNLSKHQQLLYLNYDHFVNVIDVDSNNLEIFGFVNLKESNYEKIFDIIRKSCKLKQLVLIGYFPIKSQSYHNNITKRLGRVLPLLHDLSKLELWYCMLTDTIIQLPLELKSLKNIKLVHVIMSLKPWQKFVDSLPSIPHTVNVSVLSCYVTGDGEKVNVDRLTLILQGLWGGKGNDAIQYVKDQYQLFHVKNDDYHRFDFSTKQL